MTANIAMAMRAVLTRPMRSAIQPNVSAPMAWPKFALLMRRPMLCGAMCQSRTSTGST